MGIIKEFEDLGQLALHFESMEIAVKHEEKRGLEKALVLIEQDAKAQIGHYQPDVGGFPAWAPLADGTENEKGRLGYPLGAPLLRTGDMRDSFQHEVTSPEEGVVGSTDPTMVYHEFGTRKMPPRPVMGPAVVRNRERIQKILGQAIVRGILGGESIAESAGYFGGDL